MRKKAPKKKTTKATKKKATKKKATKTKATKTKASKKKATKKKASKKKATKPAAKKRAAKQDAPKPGMPQFYLGGLASIDALDAAKRRTLLQAISEAGGGIVDDAIVELLNGPLAANDRTDVTKAIDIEEVIDNVWDMYVGTTIFEEMDRLAGEIDDTSERESDLRAAFARFFLTRAAAKNVPMALIARVDRG